MEQKTNDAGYIRQYYDAIQSGEEPAGRWIRLLYDWLIRGLKSREFYYDHAKADRAIRFIETFCRHNKGRLAPGRLKLSLWQKAFIATLYGIVDADGHRQFREAALFVGRKCGKTLLASAIIAYEAYIDGEYGSEIYCLAPKLEQSDLVYSAFEFTKDRNPDLAKRTRKRKTDYIIDATNTTIRKVAFSEKRADGYSPMLTVADEIAAWPGVRGLRQYEVMTSGTGARQEPITLAISSGGYVNDGIYDELYKRGTRVLLGTATEKHFLPVFYQIDDPTKWDDIDELRKALPGLGVSVTEDYIRQEIDIARGSLSKKAEFLTKYANVKSQSAQAWLKAADIEKAYTGKPIDLEAFRGSVCLAGIDLSQTTDLTAAVILLEQSGRIYITAHFWLPGAKIEDAIARDGLPYDAYIERGILSTSGEQYIDYHDVYDWFKTTTRTHGLQPYVIGYDRWSATYLVQEMQADGYKMDDVRQGYNLSPIIKDFEAMLAEGKIDIGDNDLLKAHLYGTALQTERGGERVRIIKLDTTTHIDGTAAVIDAMTVRDKWWGDYSVAIQGITPTQEPIDTKTQAELEAEIDAELAAVEAEIDAEFDTGGHDDTWA